LYGCETICHIKGRTQIVFENRVLKKEEVEGDWRRLHNEEFLIMHALPNIIRLIKSRTMRWVRYVARMEEMINAYSILDGKPEGRHHLEYLDVDGRRIYKFLQRPF